MIAPARHPRPAHHTIAGFLARIGEVTLGLIGRALQSARLLRRRLHHPGSAAARTRAAAPHGVVAQMEQTGVNALPIVGLLSFLIGVVLAYQGADQLRRFGAEIYTVNLTRRRRSCASSGC